MSLIIVKLIASKGSYILATLSPDEQIPYGWMVYRVFLKGRKPKFWLKDILASMDLSNADLDSITDPIVLLDVDNRYVYKFKK